jgi:hypothetical protein
MLCILYVTLVGACLGAAGLLIESLLPATAARRWIWCLVIPASIFLPGYYRFHHNLSVTAMMNERARMPGMASMGYLDWWARSDVFDRIINRGWYIASVVLISLGIANVLRVSWLLFLARRKQRDLDAPSTVDGVRVVVTDSLGPATVGLLRSRVVLPQWVLALPGAQRSYVVRHEEEHRRAHDVHLLLLFSLTLILMPWNAALWWHLRRLRLAVEMDCDNRVVAALGNPTAYGALLINVAQAGSRGPRLQPALLGGMKSLEHRLRAMLSPRSLTVAQRVALTGVVFALLTLVLAMPHPITGR